MINKSHKLFIEAYFSTIAPNKPKHANINIKIFQLEQSLNFKPENIENVIKLAKA